MNYLNNPHHNDVFSHGRRHIASVDVNMVGNVLGYTPDYVSLANDRKIINFVIESIEKQSYFLFKPNKLTVGNVTFKLFNNKDSEKSLKISLKGGGSFSSTSDTSCDIRFVDWFTQYYDFSEDSEFTKSLLTLVKVYYEKLINICIRQFHKQCDPNVGKYYNPEVCARNISFCFWSSITMINAIDLNSYEDLEIASFKSSTYYVNKFEDVVNEIKGTNLKYSRLYYNDETTKQEQKHKVDLVRAIYSLN